MPTTPYFYMTCCEQLEKELEAIKVKIDECKTNEKATIVLVHAKAYFEKQSYVDHVAYNSADDPSAILVDIQESTMGDVERYVGEHSGLYIYNCYNPHTYKSLGTRTKCLGNFVYARYVISPR